MVSINIQDIVIKNTGGNRMRVLSIEGEVVLCGWICGSEYQVSRFQIEDLKLFEIYMVEYNRKEAIHDILNMDRS